jgi:hypothetical protein
VIAMPIKKPSFTTPGPLGGLPRGVVQPNVGPRTVTPNRKSTAGVVGQRMQPVPKGGDSGGGGKSSDGKK